MRKNNMNIKNVGSVNKDKNLNDMFINRIERTTMLMNEQVFVENGSVYMSLAYICKKYFKHEECNYMELLKVLSITGLVRVHMKRICLQGGFTPCFTITDKLMNLLKGHLIEADDENNPVYFDEYGARVISELYKRYTTLSDSYNIDDIINDVVSYVNGLLELHSKLNQKARERELVKVDENEEDYEYIDKDEIDEDIEDEYGEGYYLYDDRYEDKEEKEELTKGEEIARLILSFTKEVITILTRG